MMSPRLWCPGQKQLVFAYHKVVLDLLEQGLKKQKLKWIRIDGTTLDAARQKAVARFKSTKSLDIALLSIRAANVSRFIKLECMS